MRRVIAYLAGLLARPRADGGIDQGGRREAQEDHQADQREAEAGLLRPGLRILGLVSPAYRGRTPWCRRRAGRAGPFSASLPGPDAPVRPPPGWPGGAGSRRAIWPWPCSTPRWLTNRRAAPGRRAGQGRGRRRRRGLGVADALGAEQRRVRPARVSKMRCGAAGAKETPSSRQACYDVLSGEEIRQGSRPVLAEGAMHRRVRKESGGGAAVIR